MWVLQIKEETTNEYDKFINHLNVGKEFDYSLILDMINLINVSESITNVEYIEKLIKEILRNITSLNSNVTQLDSDVEQIGTNVEQLDSNVEQIDSNVGQISTNVNNLQSEVDRVSNDVNVRSKIHIGEFNANDINEEGWYDSIVLGRPEGSESDEKYFLYHSSNGGLMCFSRRNSGKVYHRLGVNHPWVSSTHDDYSLEHSSALAINNYEKLPTEIAYNSWEENSGSGPLYKDGDSRLAEIYAGDQCLNKVIDIVVRVHLCPNDIIKLRSFYRRGNYLQGIDDYPYDSDAYIYVSDLALAGHDIQHLKSDFIKIKSLGSLGYTFSEEQKHKWYGLSFVRSNIFKDENEEYGWNYVKVNVPKEGDYYLHIAGNFSYDSSWLVIDKGYIYNDTNKLYGPYLSVLEACSTIDISFRKEGLVVGIKDLNNKIKEYWWNSSENLTDEGLVPKSMTYSYDNGTLILG